MRGITRRWRAPEPGCDEPPKESAGGADAGRVHPLVARVLRARGLTDRDAMATFCDPRLSQLHDPSGIPDLDRAAERILAGLARNEQIVIYGDYDVDGVTASAILFHMCRALRPDARVSVYIPHRIDEGYGVNSASLGQLRAEGAGLVVTVDCGVGAVEPARVARGLGLDLIITDHHNPPAALDALPDACAVVHPRRPDSSYPFGDLCGAGVAFKLAWRLATMSRGGERVGDQLRELLLDLLALASLGVVADVVPLLGENRIITRFGLSRLKATPFPGLRALIDASGLAGEAISSEHVGFALAPRLNACGRLGHAREAAELLTTAAGERATSLAQELTRLNERRKAIEREIFDQASRLAAEAGMTSPDRRAIVLAHNDWHPGVVGIVCSRLVEAFGRPAILLRRDGEACQGSGRSVDGFNLHAALEACGEHLDTYGGHDMAAGLRVATDRLPAFVEAFTARANTAIGPDELAPSLQIDCDASIDELTPLAVEQLQRLAPFGRCNPAPTVRLCGLRLTRPPEPMGAGGRHLTMLVGSGARSIRLVAWRWGERRGALPRAGPLDVVVRPKLNDWKGRVSVEGELCDAAIPPG